MTYSLKSINKYFEEIVYVEGDYIKVTDKETFIKLAQEEYEKERWLDLTQDVSHLYEDTIYYCLYADRVTAVYLRYALDKPCFPELLTFIEVTEIESQMDLSLPRDAL